MTIPRFEGTQTLDGDDSDVCSLPAFTLDFLDANDVVLELNDGANDPGNECPESARVRIGWSAKGIHLFAEVSDPLRVPASTVGSIWEGDGIEVLLVSSASGLDGDPATDGAVHAIFSANPLLAARVTTRDGVSSTTALNAAWYATIVVTDGYVVEALIPWPSGAPGSGADIAFDFALNSADNLPFGGDGRDAEAFLRLEDVSTASPCLKDTEPWCDTRTWCTPTLE